MPLKFERSETAAFPRAAIASRRTYFIRAIDKQRAPHGRHIISFAGAGRVTPLPVRQTALIESAFL
jgi:hypothetical protein